MIEPTPMDPFERLETKLDKISDRLARIEGSIARHDERTVNHHERIIALEQGQRKATWALAGAGFAVVLALIPIIVLAL